MGAMTIANDLLHDLIPKLWLAPKQKGSWSRKHSGVDIVPRISTVLAHGAKMHFTATHHLDLVVSLLDDCSQDYISNIVESAAFWATISDLKGSGSR